MYFLLRLQPRGQMNPKAGKVAAATAATNDLHRGAVLRTCKRWISAHFAQPDLLNQILFGVLDKGLTYLDNVEQQEMKSSICNKGSPSRDSLFLSAIWNINVVTSSHSKKIWECIPVEFLSLYMWHFYVSNASSDLLVGWLTDYNLFLLQIAKLKQQLQRSKPAVSGAADKDCQQGYPQGACSLGTTQVPSHQCKQPDSIQSLYH